MIIRNPYIQASRAMNLMSPKIGVMKNVGKAHLQNQDPEIIAYTIFNPDTTFLGAEAYSGTSGGCGFDWLPSYLAALGEGVERYASTFYDLASMKYAAYQDFAPGAAIHPKEFSLFHEKQYADEKFPYVPFEADTPQYWDKMHNLITGKEQYVPATFIYLPFFKEKVHISEQISTGLASHVDEKKAVLNALYEVIERDAFTITWMNLMDIEKIKITGDLAKLIKKTVPENYEVHLFAMTTDLGVPSVFGILTGEQDFGDFVAFSAATRSNYIDAIHKTILELCQSVPYYRYLLEENKDKDFHNFEQIKTFQEHSLIYTNRKDLRNIFQHWLDKPASLEIDQDPPPQSDTQKIRKILTRFQELGYDVLFKEITTVDVHQAGYRVVRIFCPQSIHLNGTYGHYYLGGKRLYEVPVRLGYPAKDFDQLNPYPHPFP